MDRVRLYSPTRPTYIHHIELCALYSGRNEVTVLITRRGNLGGLPFTLVRDIKPKASSECSLRLPSLSTMILTNGTYDIVNHSRIPRRAGAPPGSIAVGAPVMAVSLPLMLPIEVQRVGEDTYQFRLQTNHTVILGHSEQARKEDLAFVKLMRSSQDALWEVSGSEDGRFRIRVPNTDRCWTIPRFGGGLPPILLSQLEGTPEQDWVFQPLHA